MTGVKAWVRSAGFPGVAGLLAASGQAPLAVGDDVTASFRVAETRLVARGGTAQ